LRIVISFFWGASVKAAKSAERSTLESSEGFPLASVEGLSLVSVEGLSLVSVEGLSFNSEERFSLEPEDPTAKYKAIPLMQIRITTTAIIILRCIVLLLFVTSIIEIKSLYYFATALFIYLYKF
jgi:hypothetical protein